MKKALIIFMITFFSCSDSGNGNSDREDAPAVFNKYTSNVTVYAEGDFVVIKATGIPNHKSPYFGVGNSDYEAYNGSNSQWHQNPNTIEEQNYTFRIPINPTPATNNQSTSLGPIGVSLNGVPFYNQYAGPNNQPLTNEINSFDQYNGHPQQFGGYHYHIEPLYLTSSDGKDALLGFLLDGYPVYGPMENDVAVSNDNLDEFHGHTHATADYPDGIYHYHITDADPYINGNGFYGNPGSYSE